MTIQLLLKIGAVGILVALLILVLSWIIPYIVEFFNDIMKLVNIGG